MSKRASIWQLQALLAGGGLFFLALACGSAYLSLTSHFTWAVAAGFGLLFLFEMMLVLNRGPIEIDEEGIGMITAMGRYHMRWDEVTSIVIGVSDLWVLGTDKHLALVAPIFWSGADKMAAKRILDEKARRVARDKPAFILPWSKNCRVG